MTSDREAEAVAVKYVSMGYHACVLRYSVKPEIFPRALCELLGAAKEEIQPNGMILCYPVISSKQYGHMESFENLLGKNDTEEMKEYLSLEDHVTNNFLPTFM